MYLHQRVLTFLCSRVRDSGSINAFSSDVTLADLLKEYRRLDDTITMRLNRANAAVRDQEREKTSSRSGGKGTIQDQACSSLWQELVCVYEFLVLANFFTSWAL